MPTRQLQQQVSDRIKQLRIVAEQSLGRSISSPQVKYRIRSTSAGRYDNQAGVIDFNVLFLRANAEAFITDTVAHEYAHHVCFVEYGSLRFPHGQQWQAVMRSFGVKPRITHNYDISAVKPSYTWECGCTSHQVSQSIHRQLVRGEQFLCKQCDSPIVRFIG